MMVFLKLFIKAIDKVKYTTLLEYEKELKSIKDEINTKSNTSKEKDIEILKKEENIKLLEEIIGDKDKKITELKTEEEDMQEKLEAIKSLYEEDKDNGPEIPGAYGLYEPKFNLVNSILYKERIDIIRNKQKEMVSKKEAVSTKEWLVNGSKREGNKLNNRMVKLALRALNGESDAIIESIKYYSKYDARKGKLRKSYDVINDLIEIQGMKISEDYLDLKYEELDLVFEYERKLQEEREALSKQREIERDEELAKKEYERELKRLEKEQNHYQNEIEKMKEELLKTAENEKEKYEKKISELLKKIEKLEEEKQTFKNLFENKAGYVYIISNIGSFGEEVFKIGTTRRLDPFERINELCNASVPFRFDPHAIMFSENCYELERELHSYFDFNRMNKVNNYKEFFRIPISDIEEFVKRKDPTVKFSKVPEAIEYRTSLKIMKDLREETIANNAVS